MLETFSSKTVIIDKKKTTHHDTLGVTCDIVNGVRTITINVIGFASYGSRRTWTSAMTDSEPPQGFNLSLMDTISVIVDNLMVSLVTLSRLLQLSIMPRSVRRIGLAVQEFPLHAKSIIARERECSQSVNTGINTLMGSLVRAADTDPPSGSEKSSQSAIHLSEDDIMGNLFIFTIGGFDTTANTLAYAIMVLALEPLWQDWVVVEIDEVKRHHPNRSYSESFPLLTRCLALMADLRISISTEILALISISRQARKTIWISIYPDRYPYSHVSFLIRLISR